MQVEKHPQSQTASSRLQQRLQQAKQFAEQHLGDAITLGDAAEAAGLEKSYFSETFHRNEGVPFREWLCRLRIIKAVSMLAERDYAISQVAYSVGFSNPRSFQRAFKRVTRTTPLALKRKLTASIGS
jgi:two-component system, response regulator YesN